MRRPTLIALLLAAVAAGLGAFGWWGCCTEAGRRQFDEMAGMVPMLAALLAVLMLLAAAGFACAALRSA